MVGRWPGAASQTLDTQTRNGSSRTAKPAPPKPNPRIRGRGSRIPLPRTRKPREFHPWIPQNQTRNEAVQSERASEQRDRTGRKAGSRSSSPSSSTRLVRASPRTRPPPPPPPRPAPSARRASPWCWCWWVWLSPSSLARSLPRPGSRCQSRALAAWCAGVV